jgi:hypothetical protein
MQDTMITITSDAIAAGISCETLIAKYAIAIKEHKEKNERNITKFKFKFTSR